MRIAGRRLEGCALLLLVCACIHRPLPTEDDGGTIVVGTGGQSGTAGQGGQPAINCDEGDPRLELAGPTLTVLDQPPTSTSLYTSLLWTGGEYLFIWRLFGGASVLMQRIAGNSQAVGGNIRVRDAEAPLDVAWGGSRLAAVWSRQDAAVGRRLMFQTFDGLGRPLIEETTLRVSASIAYDGSVSYGPRIAALGDRFVIVWTERTNQILVATVGLDGQLLQGPILAGGDNLNSGAYLSLAAGDDRFIVGWNGKPPATSPPDEIWKNLTASRVFLSDLTPLGDADTLDTEAFASSPQVLWVGGGFMTSLVLWTHGVPFDADASVVDAEVRIAQLNGAGGLTASGRADPPVIGPYRYLMPAAWNGDHLVLLWSGGTSSDTGLTLTRFSPGGARQGASLSVPTRSPPTDLYLTAHDGTLGFTWTESVGGGYQVYFQQARACPPIN